MLKFMEIFGFAGLFSVFELFAWDSLIHRLLAINSTTIIITGVNYLLSSHFFGMIF